MLCGAFWLCCLYRCVYCFLVLLSAIGEKGYSDPEYLQHTRGGATSRKPRQTRELPATLSAMAWPSTSHEFINCFPLHERSTIQLLPDRFKHLSGSHWTREHLVACRVLIQPVNEIPVLVPYMSTARTMMETLDNAKDLMKLTPSEISRCNHADLRKQGGVFDSFYIALADMIRLPPLDTAAGDRPKRVSKVVSHPGFSPGIGLSSSPEPPESSQGSESQSEYKSSPPQARDYEVQQGRTKHEAVSSDLAAQFISSVLDNLADHPDPNTTIEFTHAPTTFVLTSKNLECTCQDDGSIILGERSHHDQKWSFAELLCSLEAKARYTEEDTSSGLGIVSDQVMAQQVCEMLGSAMSRVKSRGDQFLDEKDRQ